MTWLQSLSVSSRNYFLRELPSFIGLLAALLAITLIPNLQITDALWAGIGIACVAATTALSLLPQTRVPSEWVFLLPLLTLVGFGFFRVGTGGAASMFGALIILPVIWIASLEGRRHIAIAAIATSVVLFFPYLCGTAAWDDGQVLRGFFAPLVYLAVAGIVNDLAHRARVQLAAAHELSEERAERLLEAERNGALLEEAAVTLRQAEAFNRSVWDAVVFEAVIVTDLRGLIIAWNPGAERMLGVSAADAEDKKYITDFLDSEMLRSRAASFKAGVDPVTDHEEFAGLVAAAQRTWGSNAEWSLVRADGDRVPVQLSGSERLDETGEHVGFIFVGTDVTQAHEVARLKDEFVGMISHELRTPLSSILGYLELIRDDDEAPLTAEQLQYLGVAERNANRLLSLVGDLLFTAQVESGKFPLERREVDLRAIVEASLESATPGAKGRGVTLAADLPPSELVVYGDAMRLGQACDNLLSNAVKFTPSGGTVRVSLDESGERARIRFDDTGMGIPAAEVDRLFTRFFRSSTATRQAVQGVGLGLSITKAIVIAHGGTLDVESTEGEGTCFTMSIPRRHRG
ncbi:ATP-binding protein [Rathayibacter sp. YIM 133350]|uniref:ATP-binding protein n=1 Tax=Rathayibacter sp. YIM 133350 TaxID=3131992 RepID=UPI00307F7B7E